RQPWIMAPGPTMTPSSMMRSLSGSRCKTVFSRIWTSRPMRTGPWESPMILTPAPMIVRSPTTTSPVSSAVGNSVADAATVGRVPELAEVADDGSDDRAAVAEHASTPDDRRHRVGADDDGVLQHGRAGPDFDTRAVGADDGAFGDDRSLTQTRGSQDHRGAGNAQRARFEVDGRGGGS